MRASWIVLVCLFLAGCGNMQSFQEQVNIDLASQPVVFRDQWARRDPPMVYVQPKYPPVRVDTALFVPFRVTQVITEPELVGYSTARVFWQTWLSMQLIPAVEFASDLGPYRRDRAIALARAKNADVVIGGFVTHYNHGGSLGDSSLALQIEIHDARSGELIWSMAQSALMPRGETNDFILFATKTRLPSDPMYVLTKVMAEDMGKAVHASFNPPPSATGLERMEQEFDREWRGDDRSQPQAIPQESLGGPQAF